MTKFETGATYETKSICQKNTILNFKILRRTDASVWIAVDGHIIRRGIRVWASIETFKPCDWEIMKATQKVGKEIDPCGAFNNKLQKHNNHN
jgi:hypothetical protein